MIFSVASTVWLRSALGDDPAQHVRVPLDLLADDAEHRPDLRACEHVEQDLGVRRVGAVVEREGDSPAGLVDQLDHVVAGDSLVSGHGDILPRGAPDQGGPRI